MRAARGLAVASCALLAAILAAGCSSGRVTSYQPAEDACYDLAVHALQRHVAVAARPPACAGLSPAQVNIAVARAISEVTGAWPKAIARHLAYQDRTYLARLVSTVPPPAPPVQVAAPVVPRASAPARPAPDLPLDLAALAMWVLTAAAGTYLLAGWLVTWLARLIRRPRRKRTDTVTVFTVSHFSLALAGLAVWIGFVATGLAALAWLALGVVVLIAGLGMGVLAAALPGPARVGAAARQASIPVIVVAAHGLLATLTILLVLLAAIGAG